jgi:hypothetical protein
MASPFQFSVRQLLIAVTFAGLGFTALLNANSWWQSAIWCATVMVLLSAILMIIYRAGENRVFWIGFLIFGGGYFVLLNYSWMPSWSRDWPREDPLQNGELLTTRLTHRAYFLVISESQRNPEIAGHLENSQLSTPTSNATATAIDPFAPSSGSETIQIRASVVTTPVRNPHYVSLDNFLNVGQGLWLLIFAACGGKLAQWIYKTGVRELGSGVSGT